MTDYNENQYKSLYDSQFIKQKWCLNKYFDNKSQTNGLSFSKQV